MILRVQLNVKFRAFFFTFANWQQEWSFPIPPIPPVQGQTPLPRLDFSRSGVRLQISVVKG